MKEANINLEGVVNIAKAEILHHEMENILNDGLPTTIHAGEVQRVDTAILQLLVAFFKSMAAAEIALTWSGISEEFQAAAALLGLEQTLHLVSID